ncbi:hypothetical protein JMJ35_001521 [Cladonia borealis]|uniref:DUF726-domain-containing protein n=1 Tax=Cladonia borealis TaxID=184061 RepID=A0AA39V4C0_9LECA|nr:hypothetical protein JMJ35_001521 [Cladonia borealis]
MAGNEPIPDEDEPPTAVPPQIAGDAVSNGHVAEEITLNDLSSSRADRTDDFGLPVKRAQERSISPSNNSPLSDDEGPREDGQHFYSASGTRSHSPSQADAIQKGSLEAQPEQELSNIATHAALDLNRTAIPDKASTPSNDVSDVSKSSEQLEENSKIQTDLPEHEIAESTSPDHSNKVAKSAIDTEDSATAAVEQLVNGGASGGVSRWSHQALASPKAEEVHDEEEEWQNMPAYAPYDIYDDNGKLIAREAREDEEEPDAYTGLGEAGKGYTKVQLDDDARSATSMDDNTDYLFKQKGTDLVDEYEDRRDPLAQLEATKDLLTEGQRIAYVGVTRLSMAKMTKEVSAIEGTRTTKKAVATALEAMKMWSQLVMVRLYKHMEVDSSEQVMIEQLAVHGVEPEDLTPALMQNARVKNPMADEPAADEPAADKEPLASPTVNGEGRASTSSHSPSHCEDSSETASLPPYREYEDFELPAVRTPSQLGKSKNIDIDIRWTVLCDLFLVLVADSVYDSRSRTLLERVGAALKISWLDICRFEKRVTESLEMQESANKESWNEAEHLENRRKQALKRRYMMMGLATVGGSLVIGLSAGLLAPVIGAGLAAGFTTIGVAGTGGFLAGAGGTALITSGAVLTGGTIAVRASNRRTGAVQTFEYRPLHNNKRVNLIVTISGWMNGKIDDVRLPYSTVDPVMGDMYSVLWEPQMLQSMGDTINILATEALTQGLQQVLGATILVALMSALQLPIVLSKLSYLIDNPWTVSMGRANAAGLILADSLIDRNLGARPITLVGFSLGARVIFAALRELANRGAYGLIENVYLFGSPIVANKDDYLLARTVVSGRFVNGYASNDWILGYLFRATGGGIRRVAGLAPVENIPGLENIDVTSLVNGHMAYRSAMPKLLREVGWEITSDEFTEIEDPDPENHVKRQRELIREIEEVRKEAEAKPKKRFGFFKRGKVPEKKGWETYDDRMRDKDDWGTGSTESGSNVLFDIEAIKAELASEQIEVRQLESTLPPMKLDLKESGTNVPKGPQSPYLNLRETKSYDGSVPFRPRNLDSVASKASLPNGNQYNPFDKGYDEYDLSAEALKSPQSAAKSSLSFESVSRSPGLNPLNPEHGKLSFESISRSPGLTPSTGGEPSKPSFESSLRSISPLRNSHFPQDSPRQASPSRDMYTSTPPPQRPPLNHSLTVPSGSSLEHNAWADDPDDEHFGMEQEIKMTF